LSIAVVCFGEVECERPCRCEGVLTKATVLVVVRVTLCATTAGRACSRQPLGGQPCCRRSRGTLCAYGGARSLLEGVARRPRMAGGISTDGVPMPSASAPPRGRTRTRDTELLSVATMQEHPAPVNDGRELTRHRSTQRRVLHGVQQYSALQLGPIRSSATSPIWRIACQGVGVDGHCLVVVVDVVAACGAVRASAGSRRWSCSYSGAGYPKTLVRRTSAV
jgi:hypothetical protein